MFHYTDMAPIATVGFLGPFDRGSSPIDWCEPNYVVSNHVAEFFNTVFSYVESEQKLMPISNLPFFIIPPLVSYLFVPYSRSITYLCHLVWMLLFIVGLSSAYFHATLSLAGQLLDEFGILWVFNAALALWMPPKYLPQYFKTRTKHFQWFMLIFTVAGTLLGCIWPFINALVLMVFGVPVAVIMYKEVKSSEDERMRSLGIHTLLTWATAVTIWILDRALCGLWISLAFPYLHSMWHVLIAFAGYHAVVFYAYLHAQTQFADLKPYLSFFPSDEWPRVGVAYVSLANSNHVAKAKKVCHLCD